MKNKELIKKAIRLIESTTGKKVVFEEAPVTPGTYGNNINKSVSMTSKQLEKNPQEVDRIAKKGFDIKLTDLREDEMNNEDIYSDIHNSIGKELLLDEEPLEGFDTDDERYQEKIDDDLYESDNSRLQSVNKNVESMLRKMYKENDSDWKKVSTALQGAYQKIKGTEKNKAKVPLKTKF